MDRVNGVNAAELVKKVRLHAGLPASSTDKPAAEKVCCIYSLVCMDFDMLLYIGYQDALPFFYIQSVSVCIRTLTNYIVCNVQPIISI